LREITEVAGANIAAVNYYFRSKDELTRSALEACLQPINAARLKALEACLSSAKGGIPPLEAVVEALVRPMVEHSLDATEGRAPVRLLLQVRALPRPLTNTILAEQFDKIHRAFLEALGRALPYLSPAEIAMRYDFGRGAIMQILGDLDPASRTIPGLGLKHSRLDNERVIRYLIRFITEGFRAAPVDFQGSG
jgi:AcrR family transcriptional regulator